MQTEKYVDFDGIRKIIEQIKKKYSTSKDSSIDSFEDIVRFLDGFDDNISLTQILEEAFALIDAKFERLNSRIVSLDAKFERLNSRIAVLESNAR